MQLNEVDIDVKNPGLLEVPLGKEVNELPQSHFQNLIDRKGYEKVIRGLTNLEVWNKNKNPKLSQWASDMVDKLRAANKKDESCSGRLLSRVDEINAKTFAKFGTKVWNAGKSAGKSLYHGGKEALKRAGVTAQNAIVAGASAPIGANIALKYNDPNRSKKKNKDHRYSTSDVAAISTALRKNESLKSEAFLIAANKLESILEFARGRKPKDPNAQSQISQKPTSKPRVKIEDLSPEDKALIDKYKKTFGKHLNPAVQKGKATKETMSLLKKIKEFEHNFKPVIDKATSDVVNPQELYNKLGKSISSEENKRILDLLKRSKGFKELYGKTLLRGGLLGAGVAAGVGAAGYGIHKWVNRNKDKDKDKY